MIWAAAAPATQPGGPVFLIFVAVMTCIGGGGGITALLLVNAQRRKYRSESSKSEADGAQAISNAAVGLLKPLEERIERAETENRTLSARIRKADQRIEAQAADLTNSRMDLKSLRGLLRRIATIVQPSPGPDAAATVAEVRELLADHAHQLVD